jgi:hypothetical protein
VIIGDIGYRDHQVVTALGDAVNVAARLQDMTKGLECEVIVSEEVYKSAGLPVDLLPEQELSIRAAIRAHNFTCPLGGLHHQYSRVEGFGTHSRTIVSICISDAAVRARPGEEAQFHIAE